MERAAQDMRRLAKAMYLAGRDKATIAAELDIPSTELEKWAALGSWSACRLAWLGDPRGAASALRELMSQKVEAMLASGELEPAEADLLAKIGAVVGKLEGQSYDLKAAAIEVCERLAAHARDRKTGPDRLAWLGELLDGFFASLESGGR